MSDAAAAAAAAAAAVSGVEALYDVQAVCDIISRFAFDIVVLQFPDENLPDSTDVYTYIKSRLDRAVELYITADSTYGSSVDDVSALHVSCKLLVYFGSDMSVSGSMPVLVCPKRIPLDVPRCVASISPEIAAAAAGAASDAPMSVLVFLEPAYFSYLEALQTAFADATTSFNVTATFGTRPGCVDLSAWQPADPRRAESVAANELIGGMLLPRGLVLSPSDLAVVIGDKNDQIINVCLRYSNNKIINYSPSSGDCSARLGGQLKEYRERYMGVMRVESAGVIGLIIGSMGLSGDIIKTTVSRLQLLIQAAGKKSYVLVMGRLNEAKLRNFPEIDIFCLLSNDDTSLISPKTFHIPVITPYELELGLKAREWDTSYVVGGFAGADDLSGPAADAAFAAMLERVRLHRPEDAIDESDAEQEEQEQDGGEKGGGAEGTGEGGGALEASSALVAANSERRLARQFESAGADFLKTRDFQGLDYAVPAGQSLEALPGQVGIASGYAHIAKGPLVAPSAAEESRPPEL